MGDMGTVEAQINQDLKQAMLAKDTVKLNVLRSIKSAFTYAKVAPGASAEALTDDEVMVLVAKEAKKRQESADSFMQAGQPERAKAELVEKAMIEVYLPAQLSESELRELIEIAVNGLSEVSPKAMGQVIGAVKAKAGPAADGSLIARLVKERLNQ